MNQLLVYAIDDDPGDVELLRRYLENVPSRQINLIAFANIEECVLQLGYVQADLVFMDYMLGAKTGIDCLRELRDLGFDCPVIILTGRGDEEIAVQSMREGASDYIAKASLSSENLEKAVTNAVEKYRLRRAVEDQQRKLEENNLGLRRKNTELRMLTSAMNAASDQIMITDLTGKIVFVNLTFEQQTGYEMSEVLGKNASIMKSGIQDEYFYKQMWNTILSGQPWRNELANRHKDGTLCIEDVTITPVKNDLGVTEHFIAIKRNITEKKVYENQLDFLAHHDVLTGLPNRLLFSHRLTQHIEDARRQGECIAVMFVDLDRFKLINDTQGHNIGDLLLKDCANRLRQCIRQTDTLARMGGDEFTIVVTEFSDMEEPCASAERILASLSKPFVLAGREYFITASVGISIYPADGDNVETLVRNADAAMYRAKENGRNTYQMYTDALNQAAIERVNLERRLRKAIDKKQLLVYYQPQVEISTGRIVGTEALVRWQSPELGLVTPAEFIPLAEETGLIIPIGHLVMEAACKQNKAWQDAGYPKMTISVNISARQFQQDAMLDSLKTILENTGMDPQYLELELTESILMENPKATIEILKMFKSMNIGISIDDFGTGYSSLSYLKQFPVNALKIDRSFVQNITTDPDDAAISRAVIAMAHSLNLRVIAEGVETLAQLEFLQSLRCDELQGYFLGPPMPAEDLEQLLIMPENMKAA